MSITMPLPTQGHERTRVTDDQRLLAEVERVYRRFMHFPHEHAFTISTLWVAHTHLRGPNGEFLPRITPRKYFGSKTAGCGKTMAMELTTLMSYNGEIVIEPTGPGLISKIHNDVATVGLDEIDLFFGTRGTARSKERAILNGGYKRGATVDRERQDETEKRNIHAPVVMGGKNLHKFLSAETFETLRTRSIVTGLERKPAGLQLEEYDSERHEKRVRSISARMAVWGQRNGRDIVRLDVDDLMPAGLANRDREIWRVLFQVAAHVGADWPGRIQAAAKALVLGEWGDDETPVLSPAEELLHAARGAFTADETFLPTRTVIQRVLDVDGWWRQEWSSPRGASMSLADELATFGIEATREYVDGKQERGYALVDLLDVEDEPEAQPEPVAGVAEWDWDELDDED